jgi:transposase
VLTVENWAEIRRLHRSEQIPIKVIARVMGISKNTVKAALRSEGPPRYERAGTGSIVDEVEPRIRELLKAWPTMPATVIAERVGWIRSIRVLQERVAELRPIYLPPDPASRTAYLAGEIAQCDLWFPEIELPVGFGQTRGPKQLPVLVMITGYARWLQAMLIPTRGISDLFAGWWALIQELEAVPRVMVWDGEAAVGKRRGGVSVLTQATHGFRGVLANKVIICNPADPEAKGLVERSNGFLETSFLPGRTFSDPRDFNAQLKDFTLAANRRRRRALGCAPIERIEADRAAMLPLPPVAPVTGWRQGLRLARDHYVRLDSNDYSVHPGVIGRQIEVVADLERVRVFSGGQCVADHERIWAHHQTISDPAHVAAAGALRGVHRAIMGSGAPDPEQVELRALADYDAVFGIDGEGVA